MRATFAASQSVSILVPSATVPIQHYLRQPHRLVNALTDPTQIEILGEDCYRMKMKARQFLAFSLQPTVDIQIQSKADGSVLLASKGCEIRGVEFINERFHLELVGILYPTVKAGRTCLEGQADLQVQVDIPPMLWLTPKAIIEATGNGLLKSILMTIKQRLVHQLVLDYQKWAYHEIESGARDQSQALSINSSSL